MIKNIIGSVKPFPRHENRTKIYLAVSEFNPNKKKNDFILYYT